MLEFFKRLCLVQKKAQFYEIRSSYVKKFHFDLTFRSADISEKRDPFSIFAVFRKSIKSVTLFWFLSEKFGMEKLYKRNICLLVGSDFDFWKISKWNSEVLYHLDFRNQSPTLLANAYGREFDQVSVDGWPSSS